MFDNDPRFRPLGRGHENWGSTFEFTVSAFACESHPDLKWVTSVRAVVTDQRRTEVLFVRDPERSHILPGGRREDGETVEQTLRREITEEAGWSVGEVLLIGFLHYHHLTPKPAGYKYPYPDFCQLIYTAYATTFDSLSKEREGYELGSHFVKIDFNSDELKGLSFYERLFLDGLLHAQS